MCIQSLGEFKLLLPKIRYKGDKNVEYTWMLYMMAVLNFKTANDKCPPPINDPNQTNFIVRDMALLKNHTPTLGCDVIYKPSYIICKQLSDKAFDVQDNTGRVRQVSSQHLQLLYMSDQVLIHLPDITTFWWTTKYINQPKIIPNLHAEENLTEALLTGIVTKGIKLINLNVLL